MPDTQMSLHKKILMVQLEAPKLVKDTPGFNYKYFDINQMIEGLKPLFKKYGLLVLQPLTHIDGAPAIETQVISGDEHLSFVTPLPTMRTVKADSQGTDPQSVGSSITYMRRYALQSLFLLQAEDNDGATK